MLDFYTGSGSDDDASFEEEEEEEEEASPPKKRPRQENGGLTGDALEKKMVFRLQKLNKQVDNKLEWKSSYKYDSSVPGPHPVLILVDKEGRGGALCSSAKRENDGPRTM